jgi:hypothetical protein
LQPQFLLPDLQGNAAKWTSLGDVAQRFGGVLKCKTTIENRLDLAAVRESAEICPRLAPIGRGIRVDTVALDAATNQDQIGERKRRLTARREAESDGLAVSIE